MNPISASICWMLLAAAAGQADPAAHVELDPHEFGLDAVVDKTELSYEDREAYYRILEHLQQVDPRALEGAAEDFRHHRWSTVEAYKGIPEGDFPVFVDLFLNHEAYRGEPVTLSGHLVGPVIRLPAAADSGFDHLYEAHLFDHDAQSNPTTVIFTELPPGASLDDLEAEITDNVSVTGYFLKIYWYRSRAGQRQLAPLVLARSIEIRPPTRPEWPVSKEAIIALILVIASVALVIILMVTRRDRGVMSEYRRRFETAPQFDGSDITAEPVDVDVVAVRADDLDLVRRTGMRSLRSTVGWCLGSLASLFISYLLAIAVFVGAIFQLTSGFKWLAGTNVLDEQERSRWQTRLDLLTVFVTMVGAIHLFLIAMTILRFIRAGSL